MQPLIRRFAPPNARRRSICRLIAHEAVVNAELTRDRLKAALPKLRDPYGATLATEQYERWPARYG
jgi:hypothetical protein